MQQSRTNFEGICLSKKVEINIVKGEGNFTSLTFPLSVFIEGWYMTLNKTPKCNCVLSPRAREHCLTRISWASRATRGLGREMTAPTGLRRERQAGLTLTDFVRSPGYAQQRQSMSFCL